MNQPSQGNTSTASLHCDALERTGYVVAHTADGLLVDVSMKEACRQCAQGRGCGMGVLARKARQQVEVIAPAQCHEQYPPGASVTLILERSEITRLALLVYALPLLLALLVSAGVATFDVASWVVPASFFATLIVGLVGLRNLLSGRTERFRPRLVS